MLKKSAKYLVLGLIALTALSGCCNKTEADVASVDETYYTADPLETNQIAVNAIAEPEYKLQQDTAFCLKKGNEKSIFCGETR